MSKINQIENALKEIGSGEFQKLADCYIYKKGYKNINPLGSVIGSNETRTGTPDTFLRQDNGKLVFAEYTTEQNDLFGKLKGDLGNCLDESKTGIPINEIEEIIFCHNSILSPEEVHELYSECQKHGIKIVIFGIGGISFDLYQKYPGLARDFLGITIDTGQILEPDDFVANVGKNQFTTPLDTQFCFRKNEIVQTLGHIENNPIVILSGPPGVGKSRLALQVLHEFKEIHHDFEICCIFNRGPDLFDDLHSHFSQSGKFLVLVDDANRITQFGYVIDLIQNQREDQQIKVIVTVRDYARDKIISSAKPLGVPPEVALKLMESEQIRELVEKQYGIKNSIYQERITNISGGNPRLAIMAARVAVEHDSIDSIRDVSTLYDEYFASIRNDLQDLRDNDVLKVAGIISFFRVVDRSNKELMDTINRVFGITPDNFWKATQRLHACEAVNIYEHEVVKISDQVFSTYLFYLCFFRDRIIDFSVLIDNFFPRQTNRLRDAIYPCLNSFYFEKLTALMRPHVRKIWAKLIKDENIEDLYKLIEMFWFMLQTYTLNHFSDYIESLEPSAVNLTEIDWSAKSTDTNSLSIFNLLGLFKRADNESTFRTVLELAYNYTEKRPSDAPRLLNLLTETFGFDHKSHNRGYIIQKIVIETLWEKTRSGDNELFSRLFFEVTKTYLHTHFMSNESSGSALRIYKFDLLPVETIFELRAVIWNGVFQLYKANYKKEVLSALKYYSNSGYFLSQTEIIAYDAEYILPFIKDNLNPEGFTTCLIVQTYLSLLERHKISYEAAISEKFRNPTYITYKLISVDYFDKDNMSWEEFHEFKKEQLRKHTSKFSFNDYIKFFQQCAEIVFHINDGHDLYKVKTGILQVLLVLSERDSVLYKTIIQNYLKSGEPVTFEQPALLVDKLIQVCGSEQALDTIENADYPTKRLWLFGYYQVLPSDEVGSKAIDNLYQLYRDAKPGEIPWDWNYLLNYVGQDCSIVVNITNIILEKSAMEPAFIRRLEMLFNPLTEINKKILDLFKGNLQVLEKAYITLSTSDKIADFDGATLGKILSVKPDFIIAYIDRVYADNKWPHRYDDMRDYSFLWKHDDCDSLMSLAINRMLVHEKERGDILGNYLERLFCIDDNRGTPPDIIDKQDEFLTGLIKKKSNDVDLMTLIFRPISHFEENRRRRFITLFLEHNKTYDDFTHLSLEPDSWSHWGSAVPMYKKRIEYWETLLPLCNSAELLKHKLRIENQIQGLRSWMEAEKKSDFMKDRF